MRHRNPEGWEERVKGAGFQAIVQTFDNGRVHLAVLASTPLNQPGVYVTVDVSLTPEQAEALGEVLRQAAKEASR
jgi:hypothetical protein